MIDDRYRLDERIAAGGVGRVWRATDLLLERPVAVKLLRPEYAGHSVTRARFHTEARHASALNHPCVAQVYDYGHAGPGGPPYLVMEFVDGPSLADLLAVDPVEPAFALDVIAQVARGLHAAHQIGLVHRDIKPGNILIGPQGQVKITDFGIAQAAGQTPITAPGLVMGTTQYLAPERIDGGPGTPASDLYALGIVLHECLTGVPPYDGTPAEVMVAHLNAPLPPLPAAVPPALGALLTRLTAKDPAARIRDAGDLATLAARLRADLTAGRPPRDEAPAGPAPYPRQAAALAGVAALLAGAGLAGLLVSGALRAAPAVDRRPPPSASTADAVLPGAAPSATGGSASGSGSAVVPSPRGAASRHRSGRGGTGRRPSASSAPSATPSGVTGPTPGASPTPGGSPTATTVPTPTTRPTSTPPVSSSPPSSPTPSGPAPAPTTSGPLPPLPIPLLAPAPCVPVPAPVRWMWCADSYDRF